MAYQCLKCGSCFHEGTTQILRGCPDCRGMRFFFTDAPLTTREREDRLREATEAMPALIERIADRGANPVGPTSSAPERLSLPPAFQSSKGEGKMLPDGSLLVKIPKAIESRIKRAVTGWDYDAPAPAASLAQQLQTTPPPALEPAPSLAATLQEAPPMTVPVSVRALEPAAPSPEPGAEAKPETVRISNPGQYEIDVRRLLEKSPIVIQKDGTYLIHLASLFEMPKPPRP